MRIPIPDVIRWHPVSSLVMAIAIIAPCIAAHKHSKVDEHAPAFLSGVHHLGREYRIHIFYVNKSIGDSVGEDGSGDGRVCCVMLPKIWTPGLEADLRWEVYHIIRTGDPAVPERAEIEGIYHAQVPVEAYVKPSIFWVHFFPKGRVRIVVSEDDSDAEQHPIRRDDSKADQKATTASVVKELFTPKELAELDREISRDRKNYGDWR